MKFPTKRLAGFYGFTLFFLFLMETAHAESPLNGTWYNSYCSRVDLTVDSSTGMINGQYTSHTGSTGTSNVIGLVNPLLVPQPGVPTNPTGIPVSLGIQWRLINVTQDQADASWHWVSTFSGQYHQKQTVEASGQNTYTLEETLVVLNGLIATAPLPPLADIVPLMWPQTLEFHRSAPSYCQSVSPAQPVAYSPTAEDKVTGTWKNMDGEELTITASLPKGSVSGTFVNEHGDKYAVAGLFDTLAPGQDTAWQGIALTLYDTAGNELKAMAGGVNYNNFTQMELWESDLKSTNWTDRFAQETLDRTIYYRYSN